MAERATARDLLRRARSVVTSAGAHWLPDQSLEDPTGIDAAPRPHAGDPRFLCAHYPSVFSAAAAAGYRLTLAGHLHGGQCVLAAHRDKLYSAVWIHRWHGLRFVWGDALMLVGRGVADTFPVRFQLPA